VPRSTKKLTLKAEAAYRIRVDLSAVSYGDYLLSPEERSIDLKWSTASNNAHTIGKFFLYPSAREVAFSPFQIMVYKGT
jgi:hypothetical protein